MEGGKNRPHSGMSYGRNKIEKWCVLFFVKKKFGYGGGGGVRGMDTNLRDP